MGGGGYDSWLAWVMRLWSYRLREQCAIVEKSDVALAEFKQVGDGEGGLEGDGRTMPLDLHVAV